MTDQSTPTISEKIDKVLNRYVLESLKDYRKANDGSISEGSYDKRIDINNTDARTQLLNILADFAERITPEKMDRWSAQGTMKTELDAWNRCVNTITQNVKAELGAAPINSKEEK